MKNGITEAIGTSRAEIETPAISSSGPGWAVLRDHAMQRPAVVASPSQGISTTVTTPNNENKTRDLAKAVTDAPMFPVAEAIHKVATPDGITVSGQLPLLPFGGSVTLTSDLDVIASPHGGRDYGSFMSGGISGGVTWATVTEASSRRGFRTDFFLDNSVSGGGCYTVCAGGTVVPGSNGSPDRYGVNLGVSPTPSGSLIFGHGIYAGNLLGRPRESPEER